jgi:hypothetical protein
MPFTLDPTTTIGKVRLLITDRDPAEPIFDDADITAFLGMESASVKGAAALALETIATDEALTLKVIKLLQLTTDGAKLSDALLKRADKLRAQAASETAADADYTPFEIAEWNLPPFGAAEIIANSAIRII